MLVGAARGIEMLRIAGAGRIGVPVGVLQPSRRPSAGWWRVWGGMGTGATRGKQRLKSRKHTRAKAASPSSSDAGSRGSGTTREMGVRGGSRSAGVRRRRRQWKRRRL
nr:hypothetical protein CFP56_20211 [Quercus suber]